MGYRYIKLVPVMFLNPNVSYFKPMISASHHPPGTPLQASDGSPGETSSPLQERGVVKEPEGHKKELSSVGKY